MVKGPSGSEGVAGVCLGSVVVGPGNPGGPIHRWEEIGFYPRTEFGEVVWILSGVVVDPWCCGVMGSGISPMVIVL